MTFTKWNILTERLTNYRVDGDCWLWNGSLSNRGYGKIEVNGRTRGAHVVMWEQTNGQSATGRVVRHMLPAEMPAPATYPGELALAAT